MIMICPEEDCRIRDECEYSKFHEYTDDRTHSCCTSNIECPKCAYVETDYSYEDLI